MTDRLENYFPGLEGVYVNESGMSFVDGQQGKLYYCGYSIEDLAANCNFEHVAFLLLYKRLPTRGELETFKEDLIRERYLDPHLKAIIVLTPKEGHPMAVLQALLAQLAMHDPELADRSIEAKRRKAMRIIAKMPLVVTYFDNLRGRERTVVRRNDLSHSANMLYMLTGRVPTPEEERIFDVALILHMDHGCNNSTFTARVVTSTEADLYTAVIAAVGSLSGPLHGGANERVIEMLEQIEDLSQVEPFVENMIKEGKKIMGFGHRVYKTLDPRATVLRRMAEDLAKERHDDHDLAKAIRFMEVTRKKLDEMGKTQIWPNVDFFSGVVYKALGLPKDMFTAVFAIARVVGWVGHHFEQMENNRIYRPRLAYIGRELGSPYVPLEKR
ncbi:MAG: citrate/2-methylcitrate synthase [Candidatus Krumholzibacteriia bacterium]|nr:citrate/2-methylcitrate synthase [bacterium]MCB9513144.1 citrate/2-methylcitrate synthase [Candidatus Latescibacterota bacterium]MCB9514608.1 citrate/2-methylcitrate synthase [Candidatus Latescibacterota bacterium]